MLLLPGSGGSVAMLGCLAGRAAEGVDGIRSIGIALHIAGGMSRGSAVSAAEGLTTRCLRRVAGELVPQDPEQPRDFDFGAGPVACFPTTLPDLITLWRATKAPDIGTYVHVSGDAFPEGDPALLPEGPTAAERRPRDGCWTANTVLVSTRRWSFSATGSSKPSPTAGS